MSGCAQPMCLAACRCFLASICQSQPEYIAAAVLKVMAATHNSSWPVVSKRRLTLLTWKGWWCCICMSNVQGFAARQQGNTGVSATIHLNASSTSSLGLFGSGYHHKSFGCCLPRRLLSAAAAVIFDKLHEQQGTSRLAALPNTQAAAG